MSTSLADIAARITKEIEDAVTTEYPGQGMRNAFGLGRMFFELPEAMQWKELNNRVNWTGLTTAQRDEVIARVLKDIQEKSPEEIYPATWFDGIVISVDRDASVFDLEAVREQIATPGRDKNLDERVCGPQPTQSQGASELVRLLLRFPSNAATSAHTLVNAARSSLEVGPTPPRCGCRSDRCPSAPRGRTMNTQAPRC
jgi:hypothetical protein